MPFGFSLFWCCHASLWAVAPAKSAGSWDLELNMLLCRRAAMGQQPGQRPQRPLRGRHGPVLLLEPAHLLPVHRGGEHRLFLRGPGAARLRQPATLHANPPGQVRGRCALHHGSCLFVGVCWCFDRVQPIKYLFLTRGLQTQQQMALIPVVIS